MTAVIKTEKLTKAAADTIMRALPIIEFEGLRKVYVKRADVAELIRRRTLSKRAPDSQSSR